MPNSIKKILRPIVLIGLCSFVFWGCSTKKNTWVNRNYHNITSYYNIYWNADQTYEDLIQQIDAAGYDNYSRILNVFEYGSIQDTAVTNEKTNRMIEKGTKIIQKHSMMIRGVEYVKTVKEAYLMIGIAYFYQHNYSEARTFFNFVSSQFAKEHYRYDAWLWSARAYIQEKEFDMASSLLAQIHNNEKALSKKTYKEYPLVMADYYIKQEKYDEAIPYLLEGIERNKDRDLKNRLRFILAQIYQEENEPALASELYYKVIRSNAKLELDYNARLNLALCYDRAMGNSDDIIKSLERLLLDKKNEQYFGRIYYVLGQIALRDELWDEGIAYLEQSIQYAAKDRDQLSQTSILLADLYFDANDYQTAEKYYKMAETVILSDHDDYDRVKSRANNLSELVKYLDAVLFEEQMQHLASLPEAQRNTEIDILIEDYKAKQKAEAEKAAQAPTFTQSSSQTSTWYFYNEQAKSFGFNEFSKKWGRRENTDFWFLQNKPPMTFFSNQYQEETVEETVEEVKKTENYTPADKEYYAVNIPLRASTKATSDKRLEENKFLLGISYFNLVDEARLGIKTLEELLQKYPNTGYKLQAYYYLYRMNMVLNDEAGKQKYRNLLVNEFPDSDQTKQITDPNYYRQAQENTSRAANLYEYTFEAYINGAFDAVLNNVQEAERRYPGNAFMPRFKFLEAMASGSVSGSPAIIANLEAFIKNYPEEKDLVALAKETILFHQGLPSSPENLVSDTPQTPKMTEGTGSESENKIDISMFIEDIAAPHYCMIFINVPEVNSNVLMTKLADFNRKNFPDDKLTISGNNYNDEIFLINISVLRTASIAKGYLEDLRNSTYVFGSIPKEFRQLMIISVENYATFMKLKNKDAYEYFFKTVYESAE